VNAPITLNAKKGKRMKSLLLVLLTLLILTQAGFGGPDTTQSPPASEPFAWGDFTWLNGNDRQHEALLDSKYFTGTFMVDVNYNYSFNRPIDHTNVGSTSTFREGEVDLSALAFGGDFHWNNVRGRLLMQFGTRATGVPRNDNSVFRGQFQLDNAYRYISEGYGGYHWDVWHGINLDIGIFMSYVGLMSYFDCENWSYQPSYTSDNTPWFFHGARLQTFPSDRLKVELWLINGWQTYGMFNEQPGLGFQILYRPEEWISIVLNGYYGYDTPNLPDRLRVHSDNSLLIRYRHAPGAFISKAAFSITGDLGFENGGGVSPFGGAGGPAQNFISAMAYHRLWFTDEKIGWTVGGGFLHNPGRYLVLTPTGVAGQVFTENPGDKFDAWDFSTTLQYMPNEYITWDLELVHRESNVPYFAGHGGVTSPTGYNPPFGDPTGFVPDMVKAETRIIFALLVRF
jgi:opacity protein-like surface antigen